MCVSYLLFKMNIHILVSKMQNICA